MYLIRRHGKFSREFEGQSRMLPRTLIFNLETNTFSRNSTAELLWFTKGLWCTWIEEERQGLCAP